MFSRWSLGQLGHGCDREAMDDSPSPQGRYPFSVAAGVPPAVEPGIVPGGFSCGLRRQFLEWQRNNSCREVAGGSSHEEFSSYLVVLAANVSEGDVGL